MNPLVRYVIDYCCNEFLIDFAEVLERGRKQVRISSARGAITYLLHKYAGLSYPEIAGMYGHECHSTCWWNAQKHWPRIDKARRTSIEKHVAEAITRYRECGELPAAPRRLPALTHQKRPTQRSPLLEHYMSAKGHQHVA